MRFIAHRKLAAGLWTCALLAITWVLVSAHFTLRSYMERGTSQSVVIELGQQLLAEQRLSMDGTTNCLSCHNPNRGYTDGKETAVQHGLNTLPLSLLCDLGTAVVHC